MRRRERVGDLQCVVHDAIDREAAGLDGRGERRTVHVLHDDELSVATPAELVHGHDVGVVEPGRGPGLAENARPRLRVVHRVGGQDFDGDDAAEDGIAGAVDGAHPTFPELFLDLVVAERGADHNETIAV